MSKEVMKKEYKLDKITDEQKEMLRSSICKGATDQEMRLFLEKCYRSKLDPFLGDIYFFKGRDGRPVIGIGIMGYRKRAERTGKYAPGKAVHFEIGNDGLPISATAFVKKLTHDGTWHETSFRVFAKEFPGALSSKMPFHKLGINAESHALRQAFPDEFDGIFSKEELETSVLNHEISSNLIEINVDNIDDFIEKWESSYPKEMIERYISARAQHFNKNKKEMVDELSADSEKFKNEIEGWIKKQS